MVFLRCFTSQRPRTALRVRGQVEFLCSHHLGLKHSQMLGIDLTCRLVAGPTSAKQQQGGTEKAGAGSRSPSNQFRMIGGHG